MSFAHAERGRGVFYIPCSAPRSLLSLKDDDLERLLDHVTEKMVSCYSRSFNRYWSIKCRIIREQVRRGIR